jgi:hypothetical protein
MRLPTICLNAKIKKIVKYCTTTLPRETPGQAIEYVLVKGMSKKRRNKACRYGFEAMALSRLQGVMVVVLKYLLQAHMC